MMLLLLLLLCGACDSLALQEETPVQQNTTPRFTMSGRTCMSTRATKETISYVHTLTSWRRRCWFEFLDANYIPPTTKASVNSLATADSSFAIRCGLESTASCITRIVLPCPSITLGRACALFACSSERRKSAGLTRSDRLVDSIEVLTKLVRIQQ